MFNPKRSFKQTVLEKHGYYDKVYIEKGKSTSFIVPVPRNSIEILVNTNIGITGIDHHSGAIVRNDGESWKDFFVRIGWVNENGNIL